MFVKSIQLGSPEFCINNRTLLVCITTLKNAHAPDVMNYLYVPFSFELLIVPWPIVPQPSKCLKFITSLERCLKICN